MVALLVAALLLAALLVEALLVAALLMLLVEALLAGLQTNQGLTGLHASSALNFFIYRPAA